MNGPVFRGRIVSPSFCTTAEIGEDCLLFAPCCLRHPLPEAFSELPLLLSLGPTEKTNVRRNVWKSGSSVCSMWVPSFVHSVLSPAAQGHPVHDIAAPASQVAGVRALDVRQDQGGAGVSESQSMLLDFVVSVHRRVDAGNATPFPGDSVLCLTS